jgi:thioredoxin-like negative regulator of GroEL
MSLIDVDEYNFPEHVLQGTVPAVILCFKELDERCSMRIDILYNIAVNYEHKVKALMLNVKDPATERIQEFYNVVETPMILLFKKGQMIASTSGFMSEDDIISALDL